MTEYTGDKSRPDYLAKIDEESENAHVVTDNVDVNLMEDKILKTPNISKTLGHHNSTTQHLLSINRQRQQDIYETREEAAYKIFNYSIFKLAIIFERVRLYQDNIIQPRDNTLQVIEVNLNTKGFAMT